MSAKSKQKIDISGDIEIHTQNIFPIIKKWLYSEQEIFIRELISNAFDAITKMQRIATTEGLKDVSAGLITVSYDEKEKTITISDNGLGLDAEEIQKYINQIAFSGAEEFIQKYSDKDEKQQVIGHFGLGFYSAFMVADTVEIESLSYKKESQPVRWSCDGSTKFDIKEGSRKEVGTDIILHINDDNKAYLSEQKLTELVKKYANFLPVEIKVKESTVNDQAPLWVKQPVDVSEDEYKEFYTKLYPMKQPPLFWIHLNVDYPFNLKGILYFPKITHEMDVSKGNVQLYCQQVFITENAQEIIPEFLTLLQGPIDCPDFPLNVSRSYLQNDPYVQKISKHIVKKVADKLSDLYKKDKEQFEKYWEDISPFIKYGMMQNDDFYNKVKDVVMFKSSTGKMTNIDDYLERNKAKLDKKVIYCENEDVQSTYVKLCQDQELEVIFLQSVIDAHFIQFLESKLSDVKFTAVDSEVSELLVDDKKKSDIVDKDNKTSSQKIEEVFQKALNNDKLKIEVKSLKSETTSAMVIESEQMKRLKAMSSFMQGASNEMLEDYTLVLNENNPIVNKITTIDMGEHSERVTNLCQQVYDLALMSKKPLKGDQMQLFIERSNKLLIDLM